jgi:hypothetical protein
VIVPMAVAHDAVAAGAMAPVVVVIEMVVETHGFSSVCILTASRYILIEHKCKRKLLARWAMETYARFRTTTPAATTTAAMARRRPIFSRRNTAPISAANTTEVSRRAATGAAAPRLKAQSIIA